MDAMKSLVQLGFSEYEARTYSGLVGRAPMTGYAVAKSTGVPQPKVYETLNRLAARGAVVQVGSDPATWVSMPPSQLLAQLEAEFRGRLADAELQLSRSMPEDEEEGRVRPYWEAGSWSRIRTAAVDLIASAQERLFVSTHSEQLGEMGEAILEADRRGVAVDILCFGEAPFELETGDVVRHQSTEGMIYPHHQARHLALTSDSAASMWALARTGADWSAIWMDTDDLLPAVVKGFIRHDIFVQRIYRDFGPQLHELYGPGLERLVHPQPALADEQERGEDMRSA